MNKKLKMFYSEDTSVDVEDGDDDDNIVHFYWVVVLFTSFHLISFCLARFFFVFAVYPLLPKSKILIYVILRGSLDER